MAITIAERSDDYDTKCGCILVDENNTVISTGFNGYIRSANPSHLPNTRIGDSESYKIDVMIHAEHNALLNCARVGVSTINAVSYQTAFPCNWCLQYLSQAGISEVIYTDWSKPRMFDCERYKIIKDKILSVVDIKFTFVPFGDLIRKND